MASIYDVKPAFQRVLRPACRWLAARGVTPNQLTLLALALSLLGGGAVLLAADQRVLVVLPAVLFVRMALNALDGMLAREHDMVTPLGGILNEVSDVASDAALYLPLAARPGHGGALVVGVVVLAALTEVASLAGVQAGASRRSDGPMGKSDRAFVVGLLGLALGAGVPPGAWLRAFWIAVLAAAFLTLARRVRGAVREVAR